MSLKEIYIYELLADNDVEGALVYFGSGNTEEYTR